MPNLTGDDEKRDSRPLVLLVQDSPSIAETTRELLEAEGCSVLYVFDALQAQWYMARVLNEGQRVPDLILLGNLDNTDHVVAFLEALDAKAENSLPVVLHTDLPPEELHNMPRKIRAVGFVVSPSRPDDLLRLVGPVVHVGAAKIAEQ